MEPVQFGNYVLLERISHGGMAEVFRAKTFGEAGFEREVAIKLLLPQMANDKEFITMLIDEAKIAGQLNHANIAQIFDLGVSEGRYYIVQEYVRGRDLRDILKETQETGTPLETQTACLIAFKICEGLFYAHNKEDNKGAPLNLVHRDISPHNILVSEEGDVKIIDFGIAKAEGRATQTLAGLVKGKFAYMSPEQIRGLPVDHRSDVFATGILLYEMLANKSLYRTSNEFETLRRARAAISEPPSLSNPKVSPEIDAVVAKALARHVDDRFQTAKELRDALVHFARKQHSFAVSPNLAPSSLDETRPGASSVSIDRKTGVLTIRSARNDPSVVDMGDYDGNDTDIGTNSEEERTPLVPAPSPHRSMASSPFVLPRLGEGGRARRQEEGTTAPGPAGNGAPGTTASFLASGGLAASGLTEETTLPGEVEETEGFTTAPGGIAYEETMLPAMEMTEAVTDHPSLIAERQLSASKNSPARLVQPTVPAAPRPHDPSCESEISTFKGKRKRPPSAADLAHAATVLPSSPRPVPIAPASPPFAPLPKVSASYRGPIPVPRQQTSAPSALPRPPSLAGNASTPFMPYQSGAPVAPMHKDAVSPSAGPSPQASQVHRSPLRSPWFGAAIVLLLFALATTMTLALTN